MAVIKEMYPTVEIYEELTVAEVAVQGKPSQEKELPCISPFGILCTFLPKIWEHADNLISGSYAWRGEMP